MVDVGTTGTVVTVSTAPFDTGASVFFSLTAGLTAVVDDVVLDGVTGSLLVTESTWVVATVVGRVVDAGTMSSGVPEFDPPQLATEMQQVRSNTNEDFLTSPICIPRRIPG